MKSVLVLTGLTQEKNIISKTPVFCGTDGKTALAKCQDQCKALVSFGIAGALAPYLKTGDLVIAEKIIYGTEEFIPSAAWIKVLADKTNGIRANMLASDTAITMSDQKADAYCQTLAVAADMESQAIGSLARAWKVPFVTVRVILDLSTESLPPELSTVNSDGSTSLLPIIGRVFGKPSLIADMIRLAGQMTTAINRLSSVYKILGPDFSLE